MKTLVDVNVVFPILVERHAHHAAAWRWWGARGEGSVGLCQTVRLGVLRLLTNPRTMGGSPVTPAKALAAWDALDADDRTFPIDDIAGAREVLFRKNVAGRSPAPNLWTDAWLAAWAAASGYRLTSFDRGFRSYAGLEFEWLRG